MTKVDATLNEEDPQGLTAEEVAVWLEQHPEFFSGREALLKLMRIPHHSGQAVSLLEKQNDVLRREAGSLRERLHHLIATARDNDHLFMRLRAQVLHLLDARDWAGVLTALSQGLSRHFDVDRVQLLALDERLHVSGSISQLMTENTVRQAWPTLVDEHKCWCGAIDPDVAARLLGDDADVAGSVAAAPLLHQDRLVAVMVLIAEDSEYFRSSMDTLFLNHVAEVTGRLARSVLS
ncbi:MAG: DUF484 family protein [Natronospirillum sp.]|uniref:DUF484 family protein n=1 Tax=Natronospirillum sp. TaxID=2812955 RepID=UPI0025D38F68|nr:DUF484 family protein [Natronospirillum sp.]MCH8551477.1 DUF484 family protein [Natronospirillum sp.]